MKNEYVTALADSLGIFTLIGATWTIHTLTGKVAFAFAFTALVIGRINSLQHAANLRKEIENLKQVNRMLGEQEAARDEEKGESQ